MTEVEKGVPIPPIANGDRRGCTKYPLDQLEVSDSYFVECASRKERVSAASAAHKWAQSRGLTVATRKVEGGIRVWRTA